MNGHGVVRGDEMLKTLVYIKQFIDLNPSEFVFITFQEERQNATDEFAKRLFKQMILDMFEHNMITKNDANTWFKINSVDIGSIRQHRKNILVAFDSQFLNQLKLPYKGQTVNIADKGIFFKNNFYRDKWHNTENVEDLFSKNLDYIEKMNSIRNDLIISQFILTIQPNA